MTIVHLRFIYFLKGKRGTRICVPRAQLAYCFMNDVVFPY